MTKAEGSSLLFIFSSKYIVRLCSLWVDILQGCADLGHSTVVFLNNPRPWRKRIDGDNIIFQKERTRKI